jgi:hypothetical protein
VGEEIDGVAAGGGAAAEHATEFIDAVGFVEEMDAGFGAALVDVLGDEVMGVGVGGDGGEVGDAEELMIAGDVAHLLSDHLGGFAADIGIDFIEDEDGHLILGGEDGLEGEHDAGEFAAGGDGAEGTRGFTGVGCKQEFALVESGGGGGGGSVVSGSGLDADFEAGLAESEGGELLLSGLGEAWSDAASFGAELGSEGVQADVDGLDLGSDAVEFDIAAFEGLEFGTGAFGEGEDIGDGGAVLATEGLEEIDAFLELGETGGIDLDASGVAVEIVVEIAELLGDEGVLIGDGLGGGIDSDDILE